MSEDNRSDIHIFAGNSIKWNIFNFLGIIKNILDILPDNPRFLLLLDDFTRLIINSSCGQFDLFDEGCVGIYFF